MATTLKLFVWLIFIGLDVLYNWYVIEKKHQRPFYLVLNIARGFAFILWGVFIIDFQYDIFYLNYFIFAITSFWLLFDLGINVTRKKHPLYIGMHSGWIDQFGFRHQGIYYLAKVIALVWLVFSIINIYNP